MGAIILSNRAKCCTKQMVYDGDNDDDDDDNNNNNNNNVPSPMRAKTYHRLLILLPLEVDRVENHQAILGMTCPPAVFLGF